MLGVRFDNAKKAEWHHLRLVAAFAEPFGLLGVALSGHKVVEPLP